MRLDVPTAGPGPLVAQPTGSASERSESLIEEGSLLDRIHDAADPGRRRRISRSSRYLRGSGATIDPRAMASLAGKVETLATLDALNDVSPRIAELPEMFLATRRSSTSS